MEIRPKLPELTEHVSVGSDWRQLGIQLSVEWKDLNNIDQQYSHQPDKLSTMFQSWLDQNPDATRGNVLEALRKIKQNTIASNYEKWIIATFSIPQLSEVTMTDHAALFNALTSLATHDETALAAYELKTKFTFLSIDIMKLLQSKLKFDDAKQLVCTTLHRKLHCLPEVKEKYLKTLQDVKNVKELFNYLFQNRFIAYFSFQLLKEISTLVSDEKISRQFKIYEQEYVERLLKCATYDQIITVFRQYPFLKPAPIDGFPLLKFQLEQNLLSTMYQLYELFSRNEGLCLANASSSHITVTYSIFCSTDLRQYFKDPINVARFQNAGVSVTFVLPDNTSEVLIPSITDDGDDGSFIHEMQPPAANDQYEVTEPASQILQKYCSKLSQLALPVELVQLCMLYTEKIITEETLHNVQSLSGVLSGSSMKELCTTVSEDKNLEKLRVLGSVLLKSLMTVPLAYELLQEFERYFPSSHLLPSRHPKSAVEVQLIDQKIHEVPMDEDFVFSYLPPLIKDTSFLTISQSAEGNEIDQSSQKQNSRKRRHISSSSMEKLIDTSHSIASSRKRASITTSPEGDSKSLKYESHSSESHVNTSTLSHIDKKLKLTEDKGHNGDSGKRSSEELICIASLRNQYSLLITFVRPHVDLHFAAVNVKTFLSRTFQEMIPQLAHAETADDIVTLVEENCSIDNVYCLESLVDHCDILPAKALVEDYKAQVEKVLEETSIEDCLDVSFRFQSSRFILLKQDTLEIHLSNKFLQRSLKAIKDLVSKFFTGFANRLLMESIQMTERSAICVKYSVPHHLIDVLQFEANKCLHELEQEGVISLTIGHSVVLERNEANLLKENEVLRTEIASLREKLSEQSITIDMERKMNYSRMLEKQKFQEQFEAQRKIIEGKQHAIEKVFRGTAFHSLVPETVEVLEDAVIGVDKSGNIAFVEKGSRLEQLKKKFDFPDWEIHQLKPSQFLMPGFVDTHIHAPQFPVAGEGFDEPLDVWLEKHIYPCEEKFADPSFAREKYSEVVQHTLKNGTTTASYLATIHLESTKELCKIIAERKQRAFIGKANMDTNLLSDYIENTQQAIDKTLDFIDFVEEEMKNPLIQPVITPRTLPNCSRELLKQLAQIANERSLRIQSILCQVHKEIELVPKGCLDDKSCTDILDKLDLLTEKTYMAHCVHMSEEELLLLKERNVGIAHCPTANFNQRSGTMDARDRLSKDIKIGLGTDSSGGSILRAMRHAKQASNILHMKAEENGQQYTPITLDETFYMATLGGAQVLNLDDQIGNFKVGKQFDALIVDVKADNPLPMFQSQDTKKERILLDKFIHNGDDRNIIKVFVAGHEVISKIISC